MPSWASELSRRPTGSSGRFASGGAGTLSSRARWAVPTSSSTDPSRPPSGCWVENSSTDPPALARTATSPFQPAGVPALPGSTSFSQDSPTTSSGSQPSSRVASSFQPRTRPEADSSTTPTRTSASWSPSTGARTVAGPASRAISSQTRLVVSV